MSAYQIFTDATVDLPEDVMKAAGITVIPMVVEMSGRDYTIGCGINTISCEVFYSRLGKGEIARTSQITTNTYYRYFEEAFIRGRDALLISFSSSLSKSFEASLLCADRMRADYPDRKLYCVDSVCASCGLGILITAAVEKQRQGMPIKALVHWLEENKLLIDHWFSVDELDTLLRGGRISKTTAAVGAMLNVKPIIRVNRRGILVPVSKVRGRKKSMETLAGEFASRWNGGDELVVVGYGSSMDDAAVLLDMLVTDNGPMNARLVPVGPVIGAHTGATAIGVFFFGSDGRQDCKTP